MSTITNRTVEGKGYSRDRENLSRRMRTTHLGKMTRSAFQTEIEFEAEMKWCKRIQYCKNTAVIQRDNADKTMFRYSFEPVLSLQQKIIQDAKAKGMNYKLTVIATPFSSL